jgi:uncharacterized membrane protein
LGRLSIARLVISYDRYSRSLSLAFLPFLAFSIVAFIAASLNTSFNIDDLLAYYIYHTVYAAVLFWIMSTFRQARVRWGCLPKEKPAERPVS